MKIEDLTLEKFAETAKLMKQLRIPWVVVEMAKELGVKRTELMKFINDHPKNINTKYYTHTDSKGHKSEVLEVNGIYLNYRNNPETEEYVEDRKKEHWICLYTIQTYKYIHGFAVLPYRENEDWNSCEKWQNQEEDVKKFLEIPKVKESIAFCKGFLGDGYNETVSNSFREEDAVEVMKCAFEKGLRVFVLRYGEIKTPEEIKKVEG